MKDIIFLFILIIVYPTVSAQTFDTIKAIDNLIQDNEGKVETVFKKTEKNKIVTMHVKNPKYFSSIYKLAANNSLLSATYVLHSVDDTSLILNYYFDSTQLVKASVIDLWYRKGRIDESFYFFKGRVINNYAEVNGPYNPDYYLKRATVLLKKLKKRKIRFPGY